jgi:hypothetical protein
MIQVVVMKNEDDFTSLGRQAHLLVKRLTEHREREHREGSESNCDKEAEKAASSHASHEIVNELKHHIPLI